MHSSEFKNCKLCGIPRYVDSLDSQDLCVYCRPMQLTNKEPNELRHECSQCGRNLDETEHRLCFSCSHDNKYL